MYLPGKLPEDHGEQDYKGHETQYHQCQSVIEHQHSAQNAYDDHAVLYHGDQNIGKHHGNGIGVITNTSDQLAYGNIIELLMGQAFDMGEDVQAELGQDLLAGFLQDHGLEVGTDHADDQNTGVYTNQREQIAELKIPFDSTLNMADQQGRDHVVHNGYHHNQQYRYEIQPVGLGVDDQPFNQLAVGHMAVEADGLFLVFNGSVGQNKNDGEGTNDGTNNQNRQILMHFDLRLLLLQAAGDLPSSDRQDRFHTAPGECRRLPVCSRQ